MPTVAPSLRPYSPPRRFDCIARLHPDRPAVEAFIADVYREHYGAQVAHWAPTLVTLRSEGRLVAAAGYRDAAEPLYVEHYLANRVEQAIAAHTGRRVERRRIVEVGHFASVQPGEGRRLLLHLARHLAAAGYGWVVSTATRELRELLIHVGLTPFALASADPACLPAGADDWGNYYDHAPVVVAGSLAHGLAVLARQGRT